VHARLAPADLERDPARRSGRFLFHAAVNQLMFLSHFKYDMRIY
jgi:hypothetical protein